MYCECFTAGRFCDEKCLCNNCHNLECNISLIKESRKNIKNRNPQAFKQKVSNVDLPKLQKQASSQTKNKDKNPSDNKKSGPAYHITGCKCKRSGCQKKYCECFQMGVLCNPAKCVCLDCKNSSAEVKKRSQKPQNNETKYLFNEMLK